MIKVLFFAQLREVLGTHHIEMPLDKSISLDDLRRKIIEQYPAWESELCKKNLLMAINQEFSQLENLVSPGDEVAFFPPVTGG